MIFIIILQFQSTLPRRERRQPWLYPYSTPLISIHAPTKGATCLPRLVNVDFFISIHAPTKGATTNLSLIYHVFRYFNPRSHEGSDNIPAIALSVKSLFQSTLPRRERHSPSAISYSWKLFQSTLPRRERHKAGIYASKSWYISIHAPTKGATISIMPSTEVYNISIHAPTKGATNGHLSNIKNLKFQSTLPRRERRRTFE